MDMMPGWKFRHLLISSNSLMHVPFVFFLSEKRTHKEKLGSRILPPLPPASTLYTSTLFRFGGITGWMTGLRPGFLYSTFCHWSLPIHIRNHLAFPCLFALNWSQRCTQPHIFWLILNFPDGDSYFTSTIQSNMYLWSVHYSKQNREPHMQTNTSQC